MTAPSGERPRFRAGQTVKFRHPDPAGGFDLEGHGLVLQVGGEGEPVKVLPLSLLHLDVEADNLEPAKAEDVLSAVLAPNTTDTESAS